MREHIIRTFQTVRQQTETLCQPLAIEDYVIQSIEDVSPPKWHLAHSSWFFETFILNTYLANYKSFHPSFDYLFNSYYQSKGKPYPRAKRGLLSRPTVEQIYAYRRHIDSQILTLVEQATEAQLKELHTLITLGLNHEQQHQELLLIDIKYNFSHDPNFPRYNLSSAWPKNTNLLFTTPKAKFIEVSGGISEIGYRNNGFCFDNELPKHQKILIPYAISTQLVTNGEYLEFIEAGGYKKPQWWLADGWDYVLKNHWQAPLYWHHFANEWQIFTLNGLIPLNPSEPVCHISFYEADAYAKWRGAKLPSEEEWEHFVVSNAITTAEGNFLETGIFHPQASTQQYEAFPQQFFGDLWEWTASAYSAYPGYNPFRGTLGEYNGKFMSNQMVMRGGCCVTPKSHIRASYRNFFQPEKRWQFSGIRLATNIPMRQDF
jgi:ergothioneine biosynthesis protein EgtB